MSRISAVTLFVVFLLAARAAGDGSSEGMGNALVVPVPTEAAKLIQGMNDVPGDGEINHIPLPGAGLSEPAAPVAGAALANSQKPLGGVVLVDTDPDNIEGAVLAEEERSAELKAVSSVQSFLEKSLTIDPTATVSFTEFVPPVAAAANRAARGNRAVPTDPIPSMAAAAVENSQKPLEGEVLVDTDPDNVEGAVLEQEKTSEELKVASSVHSYLEESATIDPTATVPVPELVPPVAGAALADPVPPVAGAALADPVPPVAGAALADPVPPVAGAALADPVPPAAGAALADPVPPVAGAALADPVPPAAGAAPAQGPPIPQTPPVAPVAPVLQGPAAPVPGREGRGLNPAVVDDASPQPADSMEIASMSGPKPIPINIPGPGPVAAGPVPDFPIAGQTPPPPPPALVSGAIGVEPTTSGIVGGIIPFFSPINSILYQVIDSILRNVFGEMLPCDIISLVPLKIVCEPLM